jgi:hypothetical protein
MLSAGMRASRSATGKLMQTVDETAVEPDAAATSEANAGSASRLQTMG